MSEEVYTPTEADETLSLIVERLGKRQEKLERMTNWERSAQKASLRPLTLVLAAAACVALAFLLTPLWRSTTSPWDELGLETPYFEDYRSSMPELAVINELIAAKNYTEALEKTKKALKHSDMELNELDYAIIVSEDEALEYDLYAEQTFNNQLRWTYIYLLLQTDNKSEAKKHLQLYLKHKDSPHYTEAKALQKQLKQ